jgi:aerobic-type carbon monoxide dehydrogenase small subunit (CoxS/CutS family)
MTKLSLTVNGQAYGPFDVRDDQTMNDFLREYPVSPARNSAAALRNA